MIYIHISGKDKKKSTNKNKKIQIFFFDKLQLLLIHTLAIKLIFRDIIEILLVIPVISELYSWGQCGQRCRKKRYFR